MMNGLRGLVNSVRSGKESFKLHPFLCPFFIISKKTAEKGVIVAERTDLLA
jgi:hypothetical protein